MKYLAPYIFRIALSNNRIEQMADDTVTFRYTESKTGAQKRATLPMDTFIYAIKLSNGGAARQSPAL